MRAANVLDVGCESDAIIRAIQQATAPGFRVRLQGMANPYGDGHAAERVVKTLRDVPLDRRLIFKHFQDIGMDPWGMSSHLLTSPSFPKRIVP